MTPDEFELKVELGYTPEEWARLLTKKISAVRPRDTDEAERVYAEVIALVARTAELTAYEKAARVAEMPISGGHSPETRAKAEHALLIARSIRDLKGPQYLPPRRLK